VNRKIFEVIGTKLKYFNTKKIVLKLSEVMVGSGIRIQDSGSGSRIPDPGVQKAPDPGSGSATLELSIAFHPNPDQKLFS